MGFKRDFIFVLTVCLSPRVSAQYQPNWASLDRRPVPQWYQDAKSGVFIVWGVYAVPGYTIVGNYAEWYRHPLRSDLDGAVAKYRREKWGKDIVDHLLLDHRATVTFLLTGQKLSWNNSRVMWPLPCLPLTPDKELNFF